MPVLRGLNVRVTDVEGHVFDEWGVQQLRKQNKISAYIKSKSEEAFRITIQPDIPFLGSEDFLARDVHDNAGEGNSANPNARSTSCNRGPFQQSSPSSSSKYEQFKKRPYDTKKEVLPPIKGQSSDRHIVHPPFDLLASLYLDGRQTPERRVIVYLNPRHHDFPQPDGKIRFRARLAQGENGSLVEHAWVFKDVGIETVFDKMLISESRNRADGANQPHDDATATAMNAAGLGAGSNIKNDEKGGIGQIVVIVQRIIVGVKWSEENYRPRHRYGQADDINMNDLSNDITHTAKYAKRIFSTDIQDVDEIRHTYTKTIAAGPISMVDYRPYVIGEGSYAIFQFFYRSQETLEKFNFPGYLKSRKIPITDWLQAERNFNALTPLSVFHQVQPGNFIGKTFEQRIKDQSFNHEEGKRYNFNQPYREAVAVKEKIPSGSHARKRTSRSNALLRPIRTPVSFTHLSGERKLFLSELHGKEIMPYQNTSERAEIAPSIPTPRPNVSEPDVPLTAANSYCMPLTGGFSIPEYLSSPVATVRSNLQPISSETKPEFTMKAKVDLSRPSTHLSTIFEECRVFSEVSDADDERDASGLDTETEDEDLGTGLPAREDGDAINRDQDDGGLHVQFKNMTISKKRPINIDNGDEGYQSGDCGGKARKTLENGTEALKVRSFSGGHLVNMTCGSTSDDNMHEFGSSSPCNLSNIRKQPVAHPLPKRRKS